MSKARRAAGGADEVEGASEVLVARGGSAVEGRDRGVGDGIEESATSVDPGRVEPGGRADLAGGVVGEVRVAVDPVRVERSAEEAGELAGTLGPVGLDRLGDHHERRDTGASTRGLSRGPSRDGGGRPGSSSRHRARGRPIGLPTIIQ